MFIHQFFALLTKKMMGVRGLIFLRKDGTWDTLGMPDNLFIQPVEDNPTFTQVHDSIPDNRKDAWWV